ncbi:hypothetical protein D3C73_649340 [compost metagenome]
MFWQYVWIRKIGNQDGIAVLESIAMYGWYVLLLCMLRIGEPHLQRRLSMINTRRLRTR